MDNNLDNESQLAGGHRATARRFSSGSRLRAVRIQVVPKLSVLFPNPLCVEKTLYLCVLLCSSQIPTEEFRVTHYGRDGARPSRRVRQQTRDGEDTRHVPFRFPASQLAHRASVHFRVSSDIPKIFVLSFPMASEYNFLIRCVRYRSSMVKLVCKNVFL